ncbi:MAG TPA: cation diffusion facilitator family transporter [Candidatus Sulfotelmatobacter sp.]|nr:cation diffusion facilitator family transporter [Candidatus Sulfotelmatobacter sp.]
MDRSAEFLGEQRISSRKVILTSFIIDVSDLILNFSVAILSGSVVMFTQVLEALSDLASSGFLLIGFQRSQHKEDKTHPFGYGREIYFWSLLAALIMFGLTSTLSFYFGWQRFFNPGKIKDINIAIFVLVLTFFTNGYAFLLSFMRLLRKRPFKLIFRIFYRSSLVETKTTFILDLMGTCASLLGTLALVIYVLTGDRRFDGLGAMVIGIFLAIFSFFLVLGIRDLLIGKSASQETELRIKKATLEIEEVDDILDIKTLHLGSERLLVNLFVHINSRLGAFEIEKLTDKIKDRIQAEVPSAKYIQVELDTRRN